MNEQRPLLHSHNHSNESQSQSLKHKLLFAIFVIFVTGTITILYSYTAAHTEYITDLTQTDSHNRQPRRHDKGHFLVLSDIHIDLFYHSDYYNDTLGVCRKSQYTTLQCTSASVQHAVNTIHNYTIQYNTARYDCDPSLHYVYAILNNLAIQLHTDNIQLDFIVLTGDIVAHFTQCKSDIRVIHTLLLDLLIDLFDVPIIPALGNTDLYPVNTVKQYDYQLMEYAELYESYGILITDTQFREYAMYGRYRYTFGDIVIVSLNTIIYSPVYSANGYIVIDCGERIEDPFNQFVWLKQQLHNAYKQHQSVYIVGHIPPGIKENTVSWCQQYTDTYVDIVQQYQHTVKAQLYGDHSYDELRILTVKHKHATYNAVAPLFIHPAISPRKHCNPAVRVYTYNHHNAELMNYQQYNIQLHHETYVQRYHRQNMKWQHQYNFLDLYDLHDMSVDSIVHLYEKLLNDDKLQQHYIDNLLVGESIDSRSTTEIMCDMVLLNSNDNEKCRSRESLPEIKTVQ